MQIFNNLPYMAVVKKVSNTTAIIDMKRCCGNYLDGKIRDHFHIYNRNWKVGDIIEFYIQSYYYYTKDKYGINIYNDKVVGNTEYDKLKSDLRRRK